MTVDHPEPISDPGGARPVSARWVITADIVLESAAHLGGKGGDAADMVLLRDARDDGPLLPGTSLAGALRSHLADVLDGYRSTEDERVARLFGGARGDDSGAQSPVVVFDSLGSLPEGRAVEIRDGVQIDAARGTAEDHKKFDLEILPAGARFPVRFDLVVPEPAGEADLVSLLCTSLSGLALGELSLGARRSRGLGALRTENWRAVRHDLSSRDGWIAWLMSDAETPIAKDAEKGSDARAVCLGAWPGHEIAALEDRRRRIVVIAGLSSKGGLLVRNAPTEPDAPDATHMESAGESVLPGTSLAGVLRARAMRIARLVRDDKNDAELWVDRLFAPRMEGVTSSDSRALSASRLRISESVVQEGTRMRPSRVRIDRFTQGVVPGALFDEEPEHGGRVRVRIEIRDPKPGEKGLLFLLLKDLLGGDLPVGGTSAVGRGVFTGTARVCMEDGKSIRLDLTEPKDGDVEDIDREIDELWSSPALRSAS